MNTLRRPSPVYQLTLGLLLIGLAAGMPRPLAAQQVSGTISLQSDQVQLDRLAPGETTGHTLGDVWFAARPEASAMHR